MEQWTEKDLTSTQKDTKLAWKGEAFLSEKKEIQKKLLNFKEKTIAIAEKSERFAKENRDYINEQTSKIDWSKLNKTGEQNEKDKIDSQLKANEIEQESELRQDIDNLTKEIDDYERNLSSEIFREVMGVTEIKQLSEKLGISPELCNQLLFEQSQLMNPLDVFLLNENSYINLILRKQLADTKKAKQLSAEQRRNAQSRVGIMNRKYEGLESTLKILKGQSHFVIDSFIQYSNEDIEKIGILRNVKKQLEREF